ncbi:lysis system o-spanin lipoprotein Rz1 [Pseudomonas sp. S150]
MRVQPVAVQCLTPPAPAAWIMQPYEPDLTRRMLNELSPSPTKVTGD